jgi:hypothetical protein
MPVAVEHGYENYPDHSLIFYDFPVPWVVSLMKIRKETISHNLPKIRA